MTTILAKLQKGHWVATEADVETLAHERYANALVVANTDGTYLRVALVAAQAKLGKPRGRGVKPNAEAQLSVLTAVHTLFYAAVLRGVTTAEVAVEPNLDVQEQRTRSLARNSRSAFARSAMSTLTGYVRAGGDLRTLDPDTVTKRGLRAAFAPKASDSGDRIERQIANATGALVKAVTSRARDNPDKAREEVEAVMDELQKVLDSLGNGEGEVETEAETPARRATDRGPARTRVGVPMLNRGA